MREPRSRGDGKEEEAPHLGRGVTRWPAAIVLLILGLIYAFLLKELLGSSFFLPLVLVAALLGPLFFTELQGHYHMSRLLGIGMVSIESIAIGAIVLNYASPLGYKPPHRYFLVRRS